MKKLLPCLALTSLIALAACHDDHSGPVTVSLSGSVSGLTAAGLVLADGSHTATVASGATSFALSGTYATGSAYAVTVQTQPTNQLCSVANGSGTVGTTDVTNVAVSCAASGHHVGGTVSGLTAAGLVLANGADTASVTASDTSFTLPLLLNPGTAYAVTVQTQPTGQICSIANGSGTIASTDVANVVVTCAAQAFALTGSVSGLTAAGLVLANGSDTFTVPANATSFALAAVATGSSYSVAVQTQPTGLSCTVTNASGTMPASVVSNVSVSCSSVPFALGGTIQGLTTAGLVVANGADTRSVAANATTFVLPAPVDAGSTYALSVQTQPTGLSCSFSNGGSAAPSAGTMPAHDVTNTSLVCAPQSHALGGAVSGLTSGTLTLANGSDTVSVTTDGTFQLMPVAYGTPYTVTVQLQPVGLTCTVGNATGTMSVSDVSDVSVVCAVATYSVSGTVTGLTTTGLVVQNNGTDNTSVAANAAQFSMPTAVAYGSTYNVTILSQPAGQTCTVTNGSGTVSADVTNVTIDCPNSVSFTVPGPTSWTVPAGVTSITVTAYGAGGGDGQCCNVSNGGSGALVTSTLAVQPGDSVTIYVGAGGTHLNEGGGGGGLTYVGDGPTNFLIAGGGGGGGGGPGSNGSGGDAGSPGGDGGGGTGGGAGSNGSGGAAGTSQQSAPSMQTAGGAFTDTLTTGSGSGGVGGGGSTAGAGGSGITAGIGNGGDGSFFFGGGGGGGGFGGGGGGGFGEGSSTDGSGGGGGGGSVGPAGTTIVIATAGGPGAGGNNGSDGADGAVTIAYP